MDVSHNLTLRNPKISLHRWFLSISLLILFTGCNSPHNPNFEAIALCEAHKPELWKEFPNDEHSLEDAFSIYRQKISPILKSDSMQLLVADINSWRASDDLYSNTQTKIEEITNKTWNCDAFKEFHNKLAHQFALERLSETLPENAIFIQISEKNDFVLVKANKTVKTISSLQKALTQIIAESESNPESNLESNPSYLWVHIHPKAKMDALTKLITMTQNMNIKRITLAEMNI